MPMKSSDCTTGILEKLYLDTSVPNALLDSRCPERMSVTKGFWEKMSSSFTVHISEYTLIELGRTDDMAHRKALFELVSDFAVLPLTEAINRLSQAFLTNGVISRQEKGDAIHLATAVIHGMDLLVSWNFHHMVNYATKRKLPIVSAAHGYFKQLIIASPNEFFRE